MRRMLHLVYGVAVVVGLLSAGAASAQEGVANGDTSKKRIALTDGFSSNAWEQSAWNAWKAVAEQAVKDGVIADQKIITGNDTRRNRLPSCRIWCWKATTRSLSTRPRRPPSMAAS